MNWSAHSTRVARPCQLTWTLVSDTWNDNDNNIHESSSYLLHFRRSSEAWVSPQTSTVTCHWCGYHQQQESDYHLCHHHCHHCQWYHCPQHWWCLDARITLSIHKFCNILARAGNDSLAFITKMEIASLQLVVSRNVLHLAPDFQRTIQVVGLTQVSMMSPSLL